MALYLLCMNMVPFSILQWLMQSHQVMGWSASSTLPSAGLPHGVEIVRQQGIWKKLKEVGEKPGGHRRGWKVGKGWQRLVFAPWLHYSQSDPSAHEALLQDGVETWTAGWTQNQHEDRLHEVSIEKVVRKTAQLCVVPQCTVYLGKDQINQIKCQNYSYFHSNSYSLTT